MFGALYVGAIRGYMMCRIQSGEEFQEWIDFEKQKYGVNNFLIARIKQFLGCENEILFFQRRLRITEYHKNVGNKIRYYLSLILLQRYQRKYALNIQPNVCGKGLRIVHLGSILTNGKVRMGENVSLHINTCFVAGGTNDDVPIIGNNVVVGVGAIVLGGATVADGIAIGAGAVVNKSFVEEDIAIAGVPAKKISNNGRKSWNKGNIKPPIKRR